MNDNAFIITGFADEIDPSLDVQLSSLNKLGVGFIEPRVVDGKNITDLTDEEVASMKRRLADARIGVSSVGSPLGSSAGTTLISNCVTNSSFSKSPTNTISLSLPSADGIAKSPLLVTVSLIS